MKRIIIFADGTWNTPANQDQKNIAQTNVFKSFINTLPDQCPNGDVQIAYYHEGVGTGNWFDRIAGGFLGRGIDKNIKDLYKFIVEHYSPGTEIFLFGFSRGSYTVRSLAGLIRNCGILKKYNVQKAERAFFIYRSKDNRFHPNAQECLQFQQYFSYPLDETPIKFIGVWDTVGALGIPFRPFFISRNKYRFHDVKLSHLIQNAYHAVAIDENRVFFRPTLWQQDQGDKYQNQILEQCWFRGVHCDVGGGYAQGELSLVAMQYLVDRAKKLDLQCNFQIPVPDLKKAALAPQNESWEFPYTLLPRYYRIINQTVPKGAGVLYHLRKLFFRLIMRKEDATDSHLPTHECVHQSVIDWKKDGNILPIQLEGVIKNMTVIPYAFDESL